MNRNHCEKEQLVLAAVRAGAFDGELRNHVASCVLCADAMLVAEYLTGQAWLENPEAHLPDPGLLWLKAQLRSRDAALAKATRPIALVTRAGVAAVSVAGVWFAFTPSPAREWIVTLGHDLAFQHAANPYSGTLAVLTGLGSLACLLVGSLFALRT